MLVLLRQAMMGGKNPRSARRVGIVAQCDGLLSASSEPGAGSTFEVLLPVATASERRLVLVA